MIPLKNIAQDKNAIKMVVDNSGNYCKLLESKFCGEKYVYKL